MANLFASNAFGLLANYQDDDNVDNVDLNTYANNFDQKIIENFELFSELGGLC